MVQRRAARYVHNNYFETEPGTVTRMLENLGWESLEERRRKKLNMKQKKLASNLIRAVATFYRP